MGRPKAPPKHREATPPPTEDAQEGLRLITSEDVALAAPLLQEAFRVGIAKSILEKVKIGHFIETAVQGAGITTDTYYAAMRVARQPRPPAGVSLEQWKFLQKLHVEIEQADALGEMRLVDQILSSNSSTSILDYMARRWPRRFKPAEKGAGTTVNVLNNNNKIVNVATMNRDQVIEAMKKLGVKPIKGGSDE